MSYWQKHLKNSKHFKREAVSFKGRREYDEYWQGLGRGRSVEVSFVNTAWHCGYEEDQALLKGCIGTGLWGEKLDQKIAENFLKVRKYGGLCFVHNSDLFAAEKSWIDIWLERKQGVLLGGQPHSCDDVSGAPSLRHVFMEHASAEKRWGRFVNIEVRNRDLLKSPRFMRALEKLQSRAPAFCGGR